VHANFGGPPSIFMWAIVPLSAPFVLLPATDGVDIADIAALSRFVNKCALHAETRLQSSTVLAVRKHPTDEQLSYISIIAHSYRGIAVDPCGLEPLGWMLHDVAMDFGFTLPGQHTLYCPTFQRWVDLKYSGKALLDRRHGWRELGSGLEEGEILTWHPLKFPRQHATWLWSVRVLEDCVLAHSYLI
jgi:hypothetical protein